MRYNPRNPTCKKCSQPFEIGEIDLAFYKKMDVPSPTLCPDCREQRRLVFHNERKLYRRKCDFSGATILSHFSADKKVPVYKQDVWWGDGWEALQYGRDLDFSRPFFEQFEELFKLVPQVSLFTDYLVDENSEYTNYAGSNKNCYLIAHADSNRDCYYGYGVKQCESCCDIYNTVKCELCYECMDCYDCYGIRYSQDCLNCSDSAFLKSCVGCRNCFGCQNLRQKEYWIFNKPGSKSEYELFLKQFDSGSFRQLKRMTEKCRKFFLTQPQRHLQMLKAENSQGDQLVNCKNVYSSFEISDAEDIRYCTQLGLGSRDCMDVHQFGVGAELLYECVICGQGAQRLRFCNSCITTSDILYSSQCLSSQHLFGCVGLRHKSFCILNKQYSKEEYHALEKQIISHMKATGEWGEFFPAHLSPFGYNETRAIEIFPLSKEQALAQGFSWYDDEKRAQEQQVSFEIPDNIKDVDDSILKKVLICEISSKSYKLTEAELKLYRQTGVPIPRRAPDQRYADRLALKNPRHLWKRDCSKCCRSMVSSYAPERQELVYCEECYLGVVE